MIQMLMIEYSLCIPLKSEVEATTALPHGIYFEPLEELSEDFDLDFIDIVEYTDTSTRKPIADPDEDSFLVSELSYSEEPKCKVYEELIKQMYELEFARNSTSRGQYRELRDQIDDLFLFDICYEKACVLTRTKSTTRDGRIFFDIFDKLADTFHGDKDKIVVFNDYDFWDDDYCGRSRNNFCNTCPSRSSCCKRFCWRVCEDNDIRDSYSYCKRWRSSDLCRKIDHCRCDDFDDDCHDDWKDLHFHRGSSHDRWSGSDGWDGNDGPLRFNGRPRW